MIVKCLKKKKKKLIRTMTSSVFCNTIHRLSTFIKTENNCNICRKATRKTQTNKSWTRTRYNSKYNLNSKNSREKLKRFYERCYIRNFVDVWKYYNAFRTTLAKRSDSTESYWLEVRFYNCRVHVRVRDRKSMNSFQCTWRRRRRRRTRRNRIGNCHS